jgi:acetylglutamate kinase
MKTQQQTVQTLLEALPYIRRFNGCTMVVEIAGATLWSPGLASSFAGDVALLQLVGMKPVVVHPATDVPTHRGLVGLIGLHGAASTGVEALGESAWPSEGGHPQHGDGDGAAGHGDGDCAAARQPGVVSALKEHVAPPLDLAVDSLAHDVTLVVADLLGKGLVPVIACEGGGEPAGAAADTLAGRLAAAVAAEKLLILSDAGGLYDNDAFEPRIVSECDLAYVGLLQAAGVVEDDMVAAVGAARAALEAGVTSAHVIDGRVEHALLLEILTDAGCGTKITLHGKGAEKTLHIP